MRIHPPKVVIDVNDPFKEALFGRKDFAESLTTLLLNVEENLVIFINAPWGEGKTTFSEMWRASLQQQKLEVIYFDAYASDYFDDPFVSFTGEILTLVDKRLKDEGADERREFKKTAVEVGKKFAGLAMKVGLKAATMGAFDATHMTELKDIGSDLASGISEIGSDIIEKKIENYSSEKDALAAFKKSLAKLAALVRKQQGFPLTILVDELDRCRPDFALGLLERIKHLFDVEGVAFILLVNRDQIESYVRAVYGDDVDAASYLLKFGTLFVDLPNQTSLFRTEKDRSDYCRELFRHFDLSKNRRGDTLPRSLNMLVNLFDLTLREIERVFTIMSLYYNSISQGHLTHDFLIPMLCILKVKRPAFYRRLGRGTESAEQLLKEIPIDHMSNKNGLGVNPEWVKESMLYCLLSETEFEAVVKKEKEESGRSSLAQMGSWLAPFDIDRKEVIPLFCSQLDRFSLQP